MNRKHFFSVAVFTACLAFAGAAKADFLPITNLGHGIVCSKKVCMFTFNRNVDEISIYKYHCYKNDPQCKSAIYIDLGGKYKDMPYFKVVNPNQNHFFYKAMIASHYNSKKQQGVRRFVMEFRTAKIPTVVWDFNKSTIEVLQNGKIIAPPHKKQPVTTDNTPTPVAVHQPKQAPTPPIAKKQQNTNAIKKAENKTESSKQKPAKANNTNTTAKATTIKQKKNNVTAERKTAEAKSDNTTKQKPEYSIVTVSGHKININFSAIKTAKPMQAKPKEEKTPAKKSITNKIISFEQMGDESLKHKRYAQALKWYRIALKNTNPAKEKQDFERILSKISLALTLAGKKR